MIKLDLYHTFKFTHFRREVETNSFVKTGCTCTDIYLYRTYIPTYMHTYIATTAIQPTFVRGRNDNIIVKRFEYVRERERERVAMKW